MTLGITQLLVVTGGAVILFTSKVVPRLARSFLSARHELGVGRNRPPAEPTEAPV